jgi:aminopeptidase N
VGHARVRFARRAGGDVVLDFRGLSYGSVAVNGASLTPDARNGHLLLPASALRTGENTVDLDFRSAIAPAGASVIRFHDATDNADYLYTLLVPADANQLFPCFDQPDLKARVTLTLATPTGWNALANGRAERVDTTGVLTWHFAPSDPISTYLIAFAAGPWAVRTQTINGRPISMYVRASRAKEAEADSLIALNARAIAWLEKYTDRPFPFQKFDFLLAPAFPFGGMEHPGAVFYNEESFIYRERPTLNQLLGRAATIFHEVSHQWFGDYTTMRWFDDLWLKEGFATYLAAVMQADLEPKANAWKTFYLRNKPAAYGVDATTGTTPVWQQLANLDQAKSNYGAIVYNKAPGILKQLNYLVGDTAFRDGLRAYLRTHAYGNATWQDLLTAVGSASHRNLADWGRNYILRPGMPVVEQQLTVRDGRITELRLVQAPVQSLSGNTAWPARVELLLGTNGTVERVPVELTGRVTEVPVRGRTAPDFVFANGRDFGYALVRLDDRSVRWLETNIGSVKDDFLRAMLWGAMWDQVRDARLDPARYVRMAMRELPRESDEQLVPTILGRASRAISAYIVGARHDTLVAELETALLRSANDSTKSYGVRKNNLDTFIGIAQTPSALQALNGMLDSTTLAGAPLRPPTRWAIVTTLVARQAPSADQRLHAEVRRDSTTEGKRRAFVAEAARPDAETKAAYWARYFGDKDLNEDWVTASVRGFNDPAHDELSRPYLVAALDSLPWIQRNRRIFFLGNWVGATIEGQRSPEALAMVDDFLRRKTTLPRDLREKILQSRDELERTVAIRRTFR